MRATQAADGDDVLLFGSPWSPPPWMKTGDHAMIGSEMPCLKVSNRYLVVHVLTPFIPRKSSRAANCRAAVSDIHRAA